jgi:hypothetical protein
MRKIKIMGLLVALCLSQFVIQCSNDDNKKKEAKTTENYSEEVIMLRNFLSKSINTDLKYIMYDSKTNNFIIGGDARISLEDARVRLNNANSKFTSKANQRGGDYKMTTEISALVQVYISPEVPSEWKIALNQAINNWNNVNSSINISIANTKSYSTIVVDSWNGGSSKEIAYGSMPYYNGQPGQSISINTYYNYITPTQKVTVMTHELGHNFGLNHTDQSIGSLIPCTPLSDFGSVMHSIAEKWIDGFTYYDKVAISTLYPVRLGTKKIFRYKKNQYFFYTTDACEITPSKDGYVFDGDAGYIYSNQISGTVPLYRSLNGISSKDHKLSTIQKTTEDVVLGYLYPTQESGTIPLYSNISSYENFPPLNHYFYTTKLNEDVIKKIVVGYVLSK